MGFFAVARDPTDHTFEVSQCHLNLWSLAGLFGRRVFLLDIGLRIKAGGDGDVSRFQLAIPFGIDEKGYEDLYEYFIQLRIAELIFGRPVTVSASRIRIEYFINGKTSFDEINVTPISRAEIDKKLSGKDSSFWTVNLTKPITSGSESYIRIRFKVRSVGRVWVWKRSFFAKNGALVDLRIADIRGTQQKSEWKGIQDRIIAIKKLNLFLIASNSFQIRSASPELHYMRLFEGRVWEPYLGRAVDLFRTEKLVIYEWRNNSTISTTDPFRAFIDLGREFGTTSLGNHFRTGFVVLIFLLIGYYLVLYLESLPDPFQVAWNTTLNLLKTIGLLPLTLFGIILFLGWVFKLYKILSKGITTLRAGFYRLEEYIFKLRMTK